MPDAVFTNSTGGQFRGLTAIAHAWSAWFAMLQRAEDRAVERVFDQEKLRVEWNLPGSLTMASGNRADFLDTLTAQFVECEGRVLVADLRSKLHRWLELPASSATSVLGRAGGITCLELWLPECTQDWRLVYDH